MTDNADPAPPFTFLRPEWLDEIDSTNDEIRRRLANAPAPPSGTTIAARVQTAGKGRMGRTWHSAVDAGLTFSFLWSGAVPIEQAATLPMACALAARDFLDSLGIDSRCKWPNDILVGDAKICGILAESVHRVAGSATLIMGMGMNLAEDPERDRLAGRAVASLSRFTGRRHDPADLLPALLRTLTVRIGQWTEAGFAGIREDLSSRLWGVGRQVVVRTGRKGGDLVVGRVASIGKKGELTLVGDDGRPFSVVSASALDY